MTQVRSFFDTRMQGMLVLVIPLISANIASPWWLQMLIASAITDACSHIAKILRLHRAYVRITNLFRFGQPLSRRSLI